MAKIALKPPKDSHRSSFACVLDLLKALGNVYKDRSTCTDNFLGENLLWVGL